MSNPDADPSPPPSLFALFSVFFRIGLFSFGGGLTGLYGVLYGVLLSEDNALLMGSLLLFLALGTTMLATRRLNWYRLGAQLNGDNGQ